MMKTILFLALVFYWTKITSGMECWTCDTKCGCRTPVAEQCPPRTMCYTLKSLSHGDIVRKGCASDCLQVNQNGKICESCEGDLCNSEQSLAPMNGFDECKKVGESRLGIRSYQPDIGSGSGYNGGGMGYNPNGIGSGTGYNPNNIGSGTGYNPNNIGSGTGYNPNNYPDPIGSGSGYDRPNGNYYPSGNVGQNPYPDNQYGHRHHNRNSDGPYIGDGTNPYNSATSVLDFKKLFGILVSICFAFALQN
ncbi:hypothetical protein FO519_009463 [Halicephalobus sp. NKZ332]|nr:hypothetical protein FO519_009463 [Halicephalobus sp. NKZ332]